MQFRLACFFFLAILAVVMGAEQPQGPPPPGNGTEGEMPRGNGTEVGGSGSPPPPPPEGLNGTGGPVQESGNQTGGGVIDWIKSKIGK